MSAGSRFCIFSSPWKACSNVAALGWLSAWTMNILEPPCTCPSRRSGLPNYFFTQAASSSQQLPAAPSGCEQLPAAPSSSRQVASSSQQLPAAPVISASSSQQLPAAPVSWCEQLPAASCWELTATVNCSSQHRYNRSVTDYLSHVTTRPSLPPPRLYFLLKSFLKLKI